MNQEEQPILNAINQSFSYDHEEPEQPEAQPASYPVLEVSKPPVFRAVEPVNQPAAQPQIVVQRPSYNAVGVPIMQAQNTMAVSIDVPRLQKQVKCWSKFLVIISYFIMISAFFKILSNVIFFFNTGSFSSIAWYDRKGNYRQIKMNESTLSFLALIQVCFGYLCYKQGKLTKLIFAPILAEYRQAESGQTNGIQMTHRKAPKMQWLKKMVKKITCGMITLTLVSIMAAKSFCLDIAHQVISQEYELMEKKNQTSIDFNFDPEQFWMNPKSDAQPVFHPFKFDDDLDFDFDFETNDDIFRGIKEEDIFKMLGNSNETNGTISIVTPFFNTTEVEPFFNESTFNATEQMPLPLGRGDHDKKHHYKHHQKHPKNMMKHGFQFDLHKMTKQEALQSVNMVVSALMVFAAFWSSLCLMFWQGVFIVFINQAKKPQATLENHFMGPEAGQTLPQAQNNQGTIQYIAVQPNQVQPQYVQVAPRVPVATGTIIRANNFE